MNKSVFQERLNEVLELTRNDRFREAVEIADGLDLEQIAQPRQLQAVAKAYEKCRMYDEAEEALLLIRSIAPKSRGTLFHLCIVAVKSGKIERAESYYREFCELAPDDSGRFVLQYRMAMKKDVEQEELIRILEDYAAEDPDDQWMLELARLYAINGEDEKCISTCDEIEIWFDGGKYVEMAAELKRRVLIGELPMGGTLVETAELPTVMPEVQKEEPEEAVIPEMTEPETISAEEPEDIASETISAEEVPEDIGSETEPEEVIPAMYEPVEEPEEPVEEAAAEEPIEEVKEESEDLPEEAGEEPEDLRKQKKKEEAPAGFFSEFIHRRKKKAEQEEQQEEIAAEEEPMSAGRYSAGKASVNEWQKEIDTVGDSWIPAWTGTIPDLDDDPDLTDAGISPYSMPGSEMRNVPEESVEDGGLYENPGRRQTHQEYFSYEEEPQDAEEVPDTPETPLEDGTPAEKIPAENKDLVPDPVKQAIDAPDEHVTIKVIGPAVSRTMEYETVSFDTARTPAITDGAEPLITLDTDPETAFDEQLPPAPVPLDQAAPSVNQEEPSDNGEERRYAGDDITDFIPQIPEDQGFSRPSQDPLPEEYGQSVEELVERISEQEILDRQKANVENFRKLPVEPDIDKKVWHFIVFGENAELTLECAREHMKELGELYPNGPKKMLKIDAEKIGDASIVNSLDRFLGNMVIVERPSVLSDNQLKEFAKILDRDDRSLLVAFTDRRSAVASMLKRAPELTESFTAVFEGRHFSARDLLDIAREYLLREDAKLSREAEAVVFEEARRLLKEETGYYRNKIRAFVEDALDRADHGGFLGIGGGKCDRDGFLIITPRHFT